MLLALGVIVLTLPFFPTLYWFVCLVPVAFAGMVLFLARQWPDRAFYLVCAGQPAILACGSTNFLAGLYVAMMLAGMVAGTMGLLRSREDALYLLLFWSLLLVIALPVWLSSHVFTLLLAQGAGLALLAGILAIRGHQFRKEFTGAHP